MSEWRDDIYDVLKAQDVRQVGYVPDAGHSRLIERCQGDNALETIVLTTEEEGVAMAAGAWLGGQRAALLLQSSGIGNCINMLSINTSCRMPLLMLVTMRGQWGEFNPWQGPMGQATRAVLEAMQVRVYEVDRPDEVHVTTEAAAKLAYSAQQAVAVLLGQRLIGTKDFRK